MRKERKGKEGKCEVFIMYVLYIIYVCVIKNGGEGRERAFVLGRKYHIIHRKDLLTACPYPERELGAQLN